MEKQITCELCGGHYKHANYKNRHKQTKKHKEAENQKLLNINTEEALQIYNQNKKIERMNEIITEFRILHNILSISN